MHMCKVYSVRAKSSHYTCTHRSGIACTHEHFTASLLFEPLLQSRAIGERIPFIVEMPIKDRNRCDAYAIVVLQPNGRHPSECDCQILLVSGSFTLAMLASYVQGLCRGGVTFLEQSTGECHYWPGPDARSVCKNSLLVSLCVHLYYPLHTYIYIFMRA